MDKRKILLVDDHPIVREGLAQFLSKEADIDVTGMASSGEEAMHLIAGGMPDLVVTDLSLQGKPGLELIKDLARSYPSLPVLVLSIHDEILWAERVLRAGAEGYIMKSNAITQIVSAIRQVLSGEIWVSERINAILMQKQVQPRKPLSGSPLDQLSDRELEVFHCIGKGMTMREIAAMFNLSSKTVDVHRDHIREKLKVKSSTELIRYAVAYVLADN
jgi:DNA-binding NarL/FixJ family response regulator